jgi:hypothetical protein
MTHSYGGTESGAARRFRQVWSAAEAAFSLVSHSNNAIRGGTVAAHVWRPASILELALERLDLVGKRAVVGGERLDLAHGVQHGGVVAPAKSPADLRQRA